MDYAVVLIYLVLAAGVFGFFFRAQLRAWWVRRKLKSAGIAHGAAEPPALTTRLYELNKVFDPFGSSAAHPSALYAQRQFVEAVDLLAAPEVSLTVVLQYVEGNSWSLASAALAALRKRPDRGEIVERVLTQCGHFSPWAMYFALELIFEAEPPLPVGMPVTRARDWWIENRWMPNIFRDYFVRCAARGDVATFAATLVAPGVAPHDVIRKLPAARRASLRGDAYRGDRRRPAADRGAVGGDSVRRIELGRSLLEQPTRARSAGRAAGLAPGLCPCRIDVAAKSAALAARLR